MAVINRALLFVLVGGFMGVANTGSSSLQIYNDRVVYKKGFNGNYIGFTKKLSARCGENSMILVPRPQCDIDNDLCRDKRRIEQLKLEVNAVKYKLKILDEIVKQSKLTDIDADRLIESAAKIAEEKSRSMSKLSISNKKLSIATSRFRRKSRSLLPLYFEESCEEQVEIQMPGGYISADILNEAELISEKKIKISSFLRFVNSSGVDIDADSVDIYYRNSKIYMEPVHFYPWVISVYSSEREEKRVPMLAAAVQTKSAPVPVKNELRKESISKISRDSFRHYKTGKLSLPSSGRYVKAALLEYVTDTECKEMVFPYSEERVYRVCYFSPKEAVESNRWTTKENGAIISDSSAGEYTEGKYRIFLGIDEEILVSRKRLVESERGSGFFGGDIKKTDGYEIKFKNLSSKSKKIVAIERIPLPNTDKIEVEFLKAEGVAGAKPDKKGKLSMNITLKPGEEKRIKVLFSIKYDKDMEIDY